MGFVVGVLVLVFKINLQWDFIVRLKVEWKIKNLFAMVFKHQKDLGK